jgi:hypothetical protein
VVLGNEDLNEFVKLAPEQLLIRWVNYHLQQAAGATPLANFGADIKVYSFYVMVLTLPRTLFGLRRC